MVIWPVLASLGKKQQIFYRSVLAGLGVKGLKFFVIFIIVIGRGGEQINKLQSETGARIQVAPGTIYY